MQYFILFFALPSKIFSNHASSLKSLAPPYANKLPHQYWFDRLPMSWTISLSFVFFFLRRLVEMVRMDRWSRQSARWVCTTKSHVVRATVTLHRKKKQGRRSATRAGVWTKGWNTISLATRLIHGRTGCKGWKQISPATRWTRRIQEGVLCFDHHAARQNRRLFIANVHKHFWWPRALTSVPFNVWTGCNVFSSFCATLTTSRKFFGPYWSNDRVLSLW